ncbi:MAG: AAA family ATPase [Prosthecobacter sp.]|nr:AAA family ATPase [Prosthecobacter sp.]
MTSEISSSAKLTPASWERTLGQVIERIIQGKGRVLLCVTGKPGAGKSTLGKQIRKKGLVGIPPRKIGVIDDGVLSIPFFGLFKRRIKSKAGIQDNLSPFDQYLKNKKLVVYVNTKPQLRVERCDVVLHLRCPDEERKQRLIKRELDGEARFNCTLNSPDDVVIPADHVFDLCLVASHDRAPQAGAQTALAVASIFIEAGFHMVNWASRVADC